MKRIIIICQLLIWFGVIGCASSESISKLETKIVEYKSELESMSEEIGMLKSNIDLISNQIIDLKGLIYNSTHQKVESEPTLNQDEKKKVEKTQCKAITKSGTQCKRSAEPGTDFCWQHSEAKTTSSTKEKKTITPSSTDRTIQTGPRGGQYYYNSSGKKVYVKKKK
jgi:hypothetical protein